MMFWKEGDINKERWELLESSWGDIFGELIS
jgi:hypothetical protein